jgi:hypothetical protein
LTPPRRGADLTCGLLAFARRQPLHLERIDVNTLVSRTAKLLTRTLGEDVAVALDLEPILWPVVADPAQLEATIANLATNARDAMPKGGRLGIRTAKRQLDADYAARHADVTPGDEVMIEVTDTGNGMSRQVMDRIFERFFTTMEAGKGSGLGLSMVFGYVKRARGHLRIHCETGLGSTFRIYLRRADDTAEATPEAASRQIALGREETVLVVEDNNAMRRSSSGNCAAQLPRPRSRKRDRGHRGNRGRGDRSALHRLDPGGLKGDVARVAVAKPPAVRVIVTSGFPRTDFSEQAGGLANVRLLQKSYRREDLGRALRDALDC